MGIVYTPESAHAKEMAKWELLPTAECPVELLRAVTDAGEHKGLGFHGYQRPFQEFPKAMHLAGRSKPSGVPVIIDAQKADGPDEEARWMSRGYRSGHDKAIEALHERDQVDAVGAAHRHYEDRNMSAKAREEAAEIDRATSRHLGEIPKAPVKKRGRPVKVRPAEPVEQA